MDMQVDGGTLGVLRADLTVPAVTSVHCLMVPQVVVHPWKSFSEEPHNNGCAQPSACHPVTASGAVTCLFMLIMLKYGIV